MKWAVANLKSENMKQLSLLFSFLLLLSFNAGAQNVYESGKQFYIYADVANVRNLPGLDADVVDKLPAGQEVTIQDIGKADKVGEDEGFWLQITYKNKGETKEGFIWSNTLSYTQMRRGNVKFVYGKERKNEDSGLAAFCLKAVRNDSIISRWNFEVSTGSLSYTEGRIKPNGNLSGVDYIVQLYFTGEACGYGNYEFNYAWTGKELLELPGTVSVADGGVYSHGEYIVYPTDSQLPENIIMKVTASGEAPDENSDLEFEYKTVLYKWDGRKATAVPQKTDK